MRGVHCDNTKVRNPMHTISIQLSFIELFPRYTILLSLSRPQQKRRLLHIWPARFQMLVLPEGLYGCARNTGWVSKFDGKVLRINLLARHKKVKGPRVWAFWFERILVGFVSFLSRWYVEEFGVVVSLYLNKHKAAPDSLLDAGWTKYPNAP